VELPFNRAETQRLMQESPGKDHGEGIPYFFKLDQSDPDTARIVSEKARWYLPGLAAFATSVFFWEHKQSSIRKKEKDL
jgi:hypothetical protein